MISYWDCFWLYLLAGFILASASTYAGLDQRYGKVHLQDSDDFLLGVIFWPGLVILGVFKLMSFLVSFWLDFLQRRF